MGIREGNQAAAADPPVAAAPSRPERSATYREIFSVRAYRHLFPSHLLSLIGDQLSKVAITSLVLSRTGSTTLAAATYAVTYIPWVVGGPLLSSYADRLPRRRVMIACDLVRLLLTLLMAIPGAPTSVLIALLFGSNLFASPFNSARAALMPDLMEGDKYVVANGLDGLVRQTAQVAGFLIGGVVVWALTARGALIADAATFLASALLILRGVPAVGAAFPGDDTDVSLLRDTAKGVRVVFTNSVLRAYVLMFWIASAFTFAYEAIAVPYAAEIGGGSRTAGMLLAAGPLGASIGAIVIGRILTPQVRMRLLLPFAVLSTAALIPIVVVQSLAVVLLLLTVAGFGSSFIVPLNSLFGRAVPTQYRGRAFGVATSGLNLSCGVTSIAAGVIAQLPQVSDHAVVGMSGVVGTVLVLALIPIWQRDDFHRGR
jgi:MFS family permease